MIPSTRRAFAVSVFALTTVLGTAAYAADPPSGQQITREEVKAAEKAWGDELVKISEAYDEGDIDKARPLAISMINRLYGYNLGPVLFKPTLTQEPQTFRLTKEGALAYFIGHDSNYPDTGFALKHWRMVVVDDVGLQINGAVANTMGKVTFWDRDKKPTTVDKTWTFKKDDNGVVRIILHHSSLPYTGPPEPCPCRPSDPVAH
ncbi:hypothetical protein ASD21_15740 [Caulobacter sp. Root1455]|nr:hypothetical protein ASD21_15740 [Caulobacter sp. Root1455]